MYCPARYKNDVARLDLEHLVIDHYPAFAGQNVEDGLVCVAVFLVVLACGYFYDPRVECFSFEGQLLNLKFNVQSLVCVAVERNSRAAAAVPVKRCCMRWRQ